MNVELIFNMGFFIFSVAFAVIIILMLIALFVAWRISCNSKNRYMISVISIVTASKSKKDLEILENMKSEYERYRGSGFSYMGCSQINSELVSRLRDKSYEKFYKSKLEKPSYIADIVERVNRIWVEQLSFTDEKMQETFENIMELSHDASSKAKAGEVVSYLKNEITAFNAFCNGRIYEKDVEITNVKSELKKHRMKWYFTILGWVLGVISSIYTIFHL